ncbi:IclR family transcriptional regulator [uncultured Desulfuromusa sp.]|uniref:IclR family transcriptional regulator n=1 Tax=uncultured Desulfuromusa sp. TaxID=219183 RepID=UPI002AA84E62|nr:IclR family transcriptional regulator [uncultured Desulfuromusa sp.]
MPGREKDSYNIRSVENALHLLEALADEESSCSLAQLSQRLDMTKASLFRMMATFENHGYVERGNLSGEYQLGLAAFEVSQKLLSKMTLLRKARPAMAQLVRQCNETVYLVVQRDREALFLEMLDNDQKVKVIPLTSQRFPLEECAAGKIFLTFDETNQPLTTDHPELLNEISHCRKQGYCIDNNGIGEGSTCIAVPLFKSGKILTGCLALIAPSFRTDENRINKELAPALKAAGEMISAQLGHNAYTPRSIP